MTSKEIQSDIEQVRLLRALTSKWRWCLTAAFIVITIISTGVMWGSANNLSQDGPPKEQFINELTASMQKDVLPDAMDIGRQALGQVNIQERDGQSERTNARSCQCRSLTQVKLLAKDLPDQGQLKPLTQSSTRSCRIVRPSLKPSFRRRQMSNSQA